MKKLISTLLTLVLLFAGCGAEGGMKNERQTGRESGDSETMKREKAQTYVQISQDEAKRMMAVDDGHVIVDVRRQDEYDAGHIPGAVLIPNESIGEEKPALLPDLDQIILIYCRSGNRSKQAAEKLAAIGYTNLYEFGGIITWTGETVAGEG